MIRKYLLILVFLVLSLTLSACKDIQDNPQITNPTQTLPTTPEQDTTTNPQQETSEDSEQDTTTNPAEETTEDSEQETTTEPEQDTTTPTEENDEINHEVLLQEVHENMIQQLKFDMKTEFNFNSNENTLYQFMDVGIDFSSIDLGNMYLSMILSIDRYRSYDTTLYASYKDDKVITYYYNDHYSKWSKAIQPVDEVVNSSNALTTEDYANLLTNYTDYTYLKSKSNDEVLAYQISHTNYDVIKDIYLSGIKISDIIQIMPSDLEQFTTFKYTIYINQTTKFVEKIEVDLKPMIEEVKTDTQKIIHTAMLTIHYSNYNTSIVNVPNIILDATRSYRPGIQLVGNEVMYIPLGSEYIEPGAIANDDLDGNLNDQIIILGQVNTNTEGLYELTYYVFDSEGNKSNVLTRQVYVQSVSVDQSEEVALNNITVTDFFMHPDKPIIYIADKIQKKIISYNYETKTTNEISFDLIPERLAYYNNEVYVTLLKGAHNPYWDEVDQEGAFAILDDDNLSILSQYDIPIDPFDLVIDQYGYIYISSGSGQSAYFKSYNRQGENIYSLYTDDRLNLEMNRINNRIYYIDTGVSPRDVEVYVIDKGKILSGYDSPYHGTYPLENSFDLSPDGQLIFNHSGVIFTASLARSVDMTYKTKLETTYSDYAFNLIENKFYGSRYNNPNMIDIYNYQTLTKTDEYITHFNIVNLAYREGKLIALTKDSNGAHYLEIYQIHDNNQLIDSSQVTDIELATSLTKIVSDTQNTDVLSFTNETFGKYEFDMANLSEIMILNEKGEVVNVLKNIVGTANSIELPLGNYYIVPNIMDTTIEYQLLISKIETDDFSDSINGEQSVPVGTLYTSSLINGQINYGSDIDVFKMESPYFIDLLFTASEHVKLAIYVNGDLDSVYSNGDTWTEFNKLKNKVVHFVIYSENGELGTYKLEYDYYSEKNDASDIINESLDSIALDEGILGFFHQTNDVDYYKINIVNQGQYYIYSVNPGFEYCSFTRDLYNTNNELLPTFGGYIELEPGTYYLKLTNTYSYAGVYKIMVDTIVEEQTEVQELVITGLENSVDGLSDYPSDVDTFTFNLPSDTYISLSITDELGANVGSSKQFSIKDQAGNYVYNGTDIGSINYFSSLFPAGTYIIEAKTINYNALDREYKINLKIHPDVIDDYANGRLFNEQYLGHLIIGETTTVRFNTTDDMDVFYIDVVTPGLYQLEYTIGATGYYINYPNGYTKQIASSDFLNLSEGRHYLYVKGSNNVVNITFNYIENDATQNEPGIINLGLNNLELDYSSDIEFLELTVTEESLFEFTISNNIEVKLFDSNNNLLYPILNAGNTKGIIQLLPGVYIVKVSRYLYNSYIPSYTINLLKLDTLGDDAPNNVLFPSDRYEPITEGVTIQNNIDYQNDYDVYIVQLPKQTYFTVESTGNIDIQYYFVNQYFGFQDVIDPFWTDQYETIYIIVSGTLDQIEPYQYSMTFIKKIF